VEAFPVIGDDHSTIATATSLVPASAAGEVIDLAAIEAAKAACASTQQTARTSSLNVKTFEVEGVSLLCDTSTGVARPLVPASHHRLLFDGIHNLAHPGVQTTKRLIKSWFVWLGNGHGYCRLVQRVPGLQLRQGDTPRKGTAAGHRRSRPPIFSSSS
jgi:hypothetical protein